MKFAGKGGRRPLIDIKINLISLDRQNPRLTPYISKSETATQKDLIKILFDHFDSEIVGLSLVQNGYFDEEPIVVIPEELPKDFNYDDYKSADELSKAYEKLIKEEKIKFIVVEGNRRVSAIKLIVDKQIRIDLKLEGVFPESDDEYVLYDISNIPAIIYPKREDVFTYLGIRHIAGNLKWEAFAQASYTADMIEHQISLGNNVDLAIKEVQKIIANRSDKLLKQYATFKLYKQAKEDLDFDVKPIINKFSLLTVAYNSGQIREYLDLPKYSAINFNEDLISSDKMDEFRNILTWIYGDKSKNKNRVLTDSRNITSQLAYVVKSEEAIKFLLKYEDLDGAYDRTSGEKEFLLKKIQSAIRAIQTSLKYAYRYKTDEELSQSIKELKEVTEALDTQIN